MKEIHLPPELSRAMADLFVAVDQGYQQTARQVGLHCSRCAAPCCCRDERQRTYTEWAYLWEGLRGLSDALFDRIMNRANAQLIESTRLREIGGPVSLRCPCNENGACLIHSHRLLGCRIHGVPLIKKADSEPVGPEVDLLSPGCEICERLIQNEMADTPLRFDYSDYLKALAEVEISLLGGRLKRYPPIALTITEMIVDGPPWVDVNRQENPTVD